MPEEETFPIQLKYMEMIRTTYTNLDVLQANRIDDDGNKDMDRTLSKTSQGICVVRGETNKKSSNYQT